VIFIDEAKTPPKIRPPAVPLNVVVAALFEPARILSELPPLAVGEHNPAEAPSAHEEHKDQMPE
jgi:hypothetical protein